MIAPADQITDVMQIARDGGELDLSLRMTQAPKDVLRDMAD